MVEFDKRLITLADCPVIPCEGTGFVIFNPHPAIYCSSDIYLAHEICHRLAGQKSFIIFYTALSSRKSKLFQYVLNFLLDWYDEYQYGHYSAHLWKWLTCLHESYINPKAITGEPAIDKIVGWYDARNVDPASMGVRDIDLVELADQICDKVKMTPALVEKSIELMYKQSIAGLE